MTSLSKGPPPRSGAAVRVAKRLFFAGVVVLVAALAASYAWSTYARGTTAIPVTVRARVIRSTLRVDVTERGNLESSKTVDGVCEVSGRENKIIFLTPEGTRVKKGDIVCKFDTAEIDKNIANQEIKVQQAHAKILTSKQEVEIQRNKNESEISEAKVEADLAKIDERKYLDGDYVVEINDLKGLIALAEFELEKAKDNYETIKALVKKGFKTLEQLRGAEQDVERARNYLERDQQKLLVKQKYEYERKKTELRSKVVQADQKLDRAKANSVAQLSKVQSEYEAAIATHKLELQQLTELQEMKKKCEIVAAQDGVVAYANQPWYDSSRQIREGAVVYFRQKIFSLPDMSNMEVKVNVHESVVKKVQVGQKAEIRVDAFPGVFIAGTVKTVSQLADSTRAWMNGGVKEYPTVITIDEMPGAELKPGMTAEVKILVRTLENVLLVPVQAVTEQRGERWSYVVSPNGVERRVVVTGESNDKYVQIVEGLVEGEEVALDARLRGVADAKAMGIDTPSTPTTTPAPQEPAKLAAAGP